VDWPNLKPPAHPDGYVLFGVSRPDTVVGVTRIAVLMSHHYGARPLAIHVALGEEPTWEGRVDLEGERLFQLARTEALALGYPLLSYSEFAADASAGIRQAAEARGAHAVVLGRSFGRGAPGFARAADSVGDGGRWPIIVIRFPDPDRFNSVLVPLTDRSELAGLQPILRALGETCGLPLSFLLLMESTGDDRDPEREREKIESAADGLALRGTTTCRTVSDQNTVASILDTATRDELIVMHLGDCRSSRETLSCRVAEGLAQRTDLPILLVRGDLRSIKPQA
jgi:nucleotide-binding universal stress UspA family protein